MPKALTLSIKTNRDQWTHVVDSVNETLRALVTAGFIDDSDDDGWEWGGWSLADEVREDATR